MSDREQPVDKESAWLFLLIYLVVGWLGDGWQVTYHQGGTDRIFIPQPLTNVFCLFYFDTGLRRSSHAVMPLSQQSLYLQAQVVHLLRALHEIVVSVYQEELRQVAYII